MPTSTIRRDEYIELEYRVPRNGVIEFEIDADGPVTSYVFDKSGLAGFEQGRGGSSSYGGFQRRGHHYQKLVLPFDGWWYLVISNPSKTYDTRVRYDVYY